MRRIILSVFNPVSKRRFFMLGSKTLMANQTHSVSSASSHTTPHEEGEMDLVATWLVFDLPRTIAGAMAGVTATVVALVFAGLLSTMGGYEFWYPFKIPAAPILHNEAMTFGMTPAVILGAVVASIIGAVLGMVYSHIVKSNKMIALLGVGFMWGTFSWIFINNLFINSFQNIRELDVSKGAAFFVLLVFGFSLSSLRAFDRIICGRSRS